MIRFLLPLLALTSLASCGGTVDTPGDASGSAAGGGGSGSTTSAATTTSASSTGTGGSMTDCPAAAPANLSACPKAGLACEYGDDPRAYCRTLALCEGGGPQWNVTNPNCPPPPSGQCPLQPIASGMCMPDGLICLYDTGAQCGCSACIGGPCGQIPYWSCSMPPAAGCPAQAPNTGTACSPEGLECVYGSCSVGTNITRTCQEGAWVDIPVPCPL